MKVVEGGLTTYYIGDYYEWRTGPTTTAVKYYYAAGQPSGEGRRIAMREGGTLTWLLGDHLGSATITATENGVLASEQKYTAWGQTRSGSVTTDRQYTGQISEPQLGLYFYNARYYDSYLARFIQADTLIPQPGNPLAWDRYGYASSNPINSIDPSGHKTCDSDSANIDECKYVSTYVPSPYFFSLPISSNAIDWIQWFGGTEFAYLDHENHITGKENWNYDGYCQGYHCGIDMGADWGTPVYAGVYGEVTMIDGGNIIISVGDYQILYQSLNGNFQVTVGDKVSPNTLIAGVGNHGQDATGGNFHLHLEVRYNSPAREGAEYKDLIGNPLLFMSLLEYEQLVSKAPNSPKNNVVFHPPANLDPRRQKSPIHRGGSTLWP